MIKTPTKNRIKHRFIDLLKLLKYPDSLISLGFGSGCITKAPGTFGTLFALITGVFLTQWLSNRQFMLLIIIGFFIGLWAIKKTGKRLGEHDSGHIVWDEIIAFWLVMYYLDIYIESVNNKFLVWIIAFAIFRFFDIVKPLGIKKLDVTYQNAWVVMLDDLLAAAYTLIFILIISIFAPVVVLFGGVLFTLFFT